MLELEEARRLMLEAVDLLPGVCVPLAEAFGRVAASDVISPLDLPLFDNSAMDGYAVRALDLAEARPDHPVTLRLAGRVAAGGSPQPDLQPGTCIRLFTGSPLPNGADLVVMQEDARVDPAHPEHVIFEEPGRPWENIRLRGEELRAGTVLLPAGERLTAGRVGLLAAVGLGEVHVRRQPVIGLVATGDELVEAGQTLVPGSVYESNRLTLAPLLAGSGAVPRIFPIVRDSLQATRQALELAFAECDGVITSGGVSVGEADFVRQAFGELGGTLEFWKVSMKPGKPFAFGKWKGKWLFGLPGNPVSAAVTFLLLVRPALWRAQGATSVEPATRSGVLAEVLANPGDRRHFVRVRVDEQGAVRSAGVQGSHRLSSLAAANGLVDVPPRTTLTPGAWVRILQLDGC